MPTDRAVAFLLNIVNGLGLAAFRFFDQTGRQAQLLAQTLISMFTRRLRVREAVDQMYFVGVKSVIVVMVTGCFTGAVFAAQIFFQFHKFGMESLTGSVCSLAMARELGPVLAALMIAGRVGSSMAAELATMKTTEQIDALRALGVSPVEFLIVPRFIALMISMPALVALCVLAGSAAGYVVAVPMMGVDEAYYWLNIKKYGEPADLWFSIIKGFAFSFVIATVACYKGLNSGNGAESVGRATTEAAVDSSIAVLISNFFLTLLLNQVFRIIA